MEHLRKKQLEVNKAMLAYIEEKGEECHFEWYVCYWCRVLRIGTPNYLQKNPRDQVRAYCTECIKDCPRCGEENPCSAKQCIVCESTFRKKLSQTMTTETEEKVS